MSSVNDWVTQLRTNNLISSELNKSSANNVSPWYIRVLSGLCGWLAAWFLVGFVAAGFYSFFESPSLVATTGVFMIVGAYFILQHDNDDFIEQIGLAISMAGQLFICFAVFSFSGLDETFSFLLLTILQVMLALIMPNYMHRFLSAYFATVAFALLMESLQLSSLSSSVLLLIVACIWLNEFSFTRNVSAMQAVGYGSTIGLIQFKTSMLFSHTNTWELQELPTVNVWLDEGLNTIVLLIVFYLMKKAHILVFDQRDKWIAISLLVLILVANIFANGIACGIAVLLFGYATQNRALLILGVVAILVNLSSYYYLLELSLLTKSFVMMGTGTGCLLLAFAWHKKAQSENSHEI